MTGPVEGVELSADPGRAQARAAATRRVAGLLLAGKVAGLVRTAVAARTLGVTGFADAYTAANAVPNVLVDVLATGATNGAVVPVQAAALAKGNRDEADQATAAMLTWVLLVTVPLAVAAILARHELATLLLGSSRSRAEVETASRMLVILLIQIPMYATGVVLSASLQARRRFLGPALAPLLSSLVVTATYLVFAVVTRGRGLGQVSHSHELLLTGGTTLGVLVLTLPLVVPLAAGGVRLRPTLRLPPGHLGALTRLGAAGSLALLTQQACTVVMLRLAAHSSGGVVVITLATTIILLPFAVIAVPLATTALPDLASDHALGDAAEFSRTMTSALRRGAGFAAAASGGAMLTAPLLAWLLLKSTPGEQGDVGRLAWTVILGAPSAVGLTVSHLLSRGMFATGHWRGAAIASSGGWALTILADVALVSVVSDARRVPALGLGQTLGFTVAAIALLAHARRSRLLTEAGRP